MSRAPIAEDPSETVRGPGPVYEFHPFRLDCGRFELQFNGKPLRVERKPMELLILLASRQGQLVTRQEIAERLWSSEVFVDTEHGINTAIRKLRFLLRDDPEDPRFILTVTGRGYRFIAPVSVVAPPVGIATPAPDAPVGAVSAAIPIAPLLSRRRIAAVAVCLVILLSGTSLYFFRHRPPQIHYTQLTQFTDSAVSPALSPDGHMLAFIRGSDTFMSADPIYVKMLPDGEAKQVTDDPRAKYGLAFSPDGSKIAYTVLEDSGFSTYEVSALGGEPHLLEKNAAGLVWLDPQHLLYSEAPTGIHLSVITKTVDGADRRAIYSPEHERGMAHYSFPSPDRRWALVVEMDGNGDWAPCRLVSLDGQNSSRRVGPYNSCTSAAWSPDGRSMYFTIYDDGHSHLWRQRFPDGQAEQITSGPTEEYGVVAEPDGRGLITSVGVSSSSLWIHDGSADRQLSSEGEIVGLLAFSPDGNFLYYLFQRSEARIVELWRTAIDSGKSEVVFPGISMTSFNLSPDGKRVLYTMYEAEGPSGLWLAPVDRSSPAMKVNLPGARYPHFGPHERILIQYPEGDKNYLEQIDRDGSHRSKVYPVPILEFQSVSPGGHWATAPVAAAPGKKFPAVMALPLDGGAPRLLCSNYCLTSWSTDGKFLFVSVEGASRTGAGRTLAIPLGPGETLPDLPPQGIDQRTGPSVLRGAQSVARYDPVPWKDPQHYAWVNGTVHLNLYRITVP